MSEVIVPAENTARTKPRSGVTVLAGPTAVGKGTVSTFIRDNYPQVWLSVSATTRAARPGEVEGVHYFFKTAEEFEQLVAQGDLLEWAVVHGQTATAPCAAPSRRPLRRDVRCCLKLICRAPGRSRQPCRRPILCSCPRPVGTNLSAG